MRKLFIISLLILLSSLSLNTTNAESYINFQEITMKNDGAKMLEKFSESDYEKYYKKLGSKRKFWGWKTYVAYEDEELSFTKETLYMITNEGTTAIEESIRFSNEKTVKKHFSVTGSLELSGGGTVKGFKLGLEEKIGSEQSLTVTTNFEENYSLKILVDPMTKMSIAIKGEGKVTNGVGKYYRFWREVKKGGFEIFTVTTEYYSIEKVKIDET